MSWENRRFKHPKYVSRQTRAICDMFPKASKDVIQHTLSILSIRHGVETKHLMHSTYTRPEEFDELWMSKS